MPASERRQQLISPGPSYWTTRLFLLQCSTCAPNNSRRLAPTRSAPVSVWIHGALEEPFGGFGNPKHLESLLSLQKDLYENMKIVPFRERLGTRTRHCDVLGFEIKALPRLSTFASGWPPVWDLTGWPSRMGWKIQSQPHGGNRVQFRLAFRQNQAVRRRPSETR